MDELVTDDFPFEDPQLPRALVVTGARRPAVVAVVSAVASELRDAGWIVEIGDALAGTLPPPPDYDAIVIVASAWARWRAIARYVEWFREPLAQLPVVLAVVGSRIGAEKFRARVLRWHPSIAVTIENSLSTFPTATRVASEVIELHARAKLTS
jgi:menaquinone-dependent protoporphyrinogen IX oxidase